MKVLIILGVLFAIVAVGVVWSCCYVAGLSDDREEGNENDD